MRLSDFGRHAAWTQILGHCSDDPYSLSACRGGGSARHLVWSLNLGGSSNSSNTLEFFLATRHISDTSSPLGDSIIAEYFSLAERVPMRSGYGEVYQTLDPVDPTFRYGDSGSDRWINNAVLHRDLDEDQFVPIQPRWCMLLTPTHIARLGGFEALRRRARESEYFKFKFVNDHVGSGMKKYTPLRILGANGLFQMSDIQSVCSGVHSASSPVSELPGWGYWMLDELTNAGIHAGQRRGRFDSSYGQLPAPLESSPAPSAMPPMAPVTRPTPKSLADDPPRCVQGDCDRASGAPKFDISPASIVLRLRARGPDAPLTVYGRHSQGEPPLTSPVLVGSLDAARAVLFFDHRVHGYNGEFEQRSPASARKLGKLTQLVCSKCGLRQFECWAAFEFTDDSDELPVHRAPHVKDYFTWFSLGVRCVGCRWKSLAASMECA